MAYMAIPGLADTNRVVAFWGFFSSAYIYANYVFFLTGNYGLLRVSSIIVELLPSTRICCTQLAKTGLRTKETSATKTQ
jgi:hypothetical protein